MGLRAYCRLAGFSLLFGLASLFAGCGGGGGSATSIIPQTPPSGAAPTAPPTTSSVTVAPIPGSTPANVLNVSPITEQTPNPTSSTAQFTYSTTASSVVGTIDTGRAFGWTAVAPGWFSLPGAQIGPLSTAVQMVFMTPGVFTGDVTQQRTELSILATLPEVSLLASALSSNAGLNDPLSSPAVKSAYQQAVAAALSSTSTVTATRRLSNRLSPALLGTSQSVVRRGPLSISVAATQLDATSATFAITNNDSNGIVLTAEWQSSQYEAAQGLYWIGALYKVNAQAYSNQASLVNAFNTNPWLIPTLSQSAPIGYLVLPPAASFWDYADVQGQLAQALTDAVSPGDTETAPAFVVSSTTDAVYVAHLYTCGVGTLHPSNALNDATLIANWPGAAGLWGKSCALNGISVGLNVLDGIVGGGDFTDLLPVSQITSIASTMFNGVSQYNMSQSASGLETSFASQAGIVISSGLNVMINNAKTKGASYLFSFLGKVADLGADVAAAGNLGNTLGTSIVTEPWQGSYLVVGNPWPVTTPPNSLSFTLLPPTSLSTSVVGYQPTLNASGSGFNNVNAITWKQVMNGTVLSNKTWTKGDADWNSRVTITNDSSIALTPQLTATGDPAGLSTWTVTLTNTSNAQQSQTFTLNYTPAAPPPTSLTFTSLSPPSPLTTSVVGYQPSMIASGSGFNNVNAITWKQVMNGTVLLNKTWTKGDADWNAKVTVTNDSSMTLAPQLTANGDPAGISTWSVTLTNTSNAQQSQTFTLNYTPASPPPTSLSFTSLSPPSPLTTSVVGYQPSMIASGSGFNNVNAITWKQVMNGTVLLNKTWTKGDADWNAKVTVTNDSSMTLAPQLTANGDPAGLSTWTVTLTNTSNAQQSQTFTLNYTPASPPPTSLSFTSLSPPSPLTTSVVGYQPSMIASGSGFNNVNAITWKQVMNGTVLLNKTWTKGDADWNAKVTVTNDSSMTLAPQLTANGDPPGLSTWTVTLTNTSNAQQSQTFTLNYTPPASLSFTSLSPPSPLTTSVVGYQPSMVASGSGFNNVNAITWKQVMNGTVLLNKTWTKGDADWNAKVTVTNDSSMTLAPQLTANGDPAGLSTWTVTLTNTSNAQQSQTFTLNYTPATPPPTSLSFTSLSPPSPLTTSVVGYQPSMIASGSGFNNVTQIRLDQVGPGSATFSTTWYKNDSNWNSKVTITNDSSMTLRPILTASTDAGGYSAWTITLTDTTNAQKSQSFALDYIH